MARTRRSGATLPYGALDRDHLVKHLLELARRVGVEHVTMRALAAEAGTSASSVHYHVKDKSALLDLLDEGRVRYAGMIRFDLGEGSYGFIRQSSEYGFGGVTYQPMLDGLIEVSGFTRSTGTAASGFTLRLSESPDSDLTPDVLLQIENYDYRDRPVTIFDLHRHPDTGAILGDPVRLERGYINRITHKEDPETGYYMLVECENRALDYGRTNGRVRSHDDQQRRAPGDRYFEHASTAGRIKVKWGKP